MKWIEMRSNYQGRSLLPRKFMLLVGQEEQGKGKETEAVSKRKLKETNLTV